MAEDFKRDKILVRPFTFGGQNNWIKLSIGTKEKIQTFLPTLTKLSNLSKK